jgi:hypothetical protein
LFTLYVARTPCAASIACQELTCTFVPFAMHTLQLVYREWN